MSLGKRLIQLGGEAVCSTESVQPFGANSTNSSNIALYELNSDGGTTNNVPDTTTNYNGTASNITYASGYIGNAAVLNGSSSFIDLGDANQFQNNKITFSFWCRALGTAAQQQIFAEYTGGALQSGEFVIRRESDEKLTVGISNGSNFLFKSTDSAVLTTSFKHFVVVIDTTQSTDDKIKIYVNNVLSASTNIASSGTVTGNVLTRSSHLFIGKRNVSAFQYFNGEIDQIRIFNKSLIPKDVAVLYAETSSTASNTNPLGEGAGVALYSLDYDASEASGYYDGTSSNVTFGVGGNINFGARFNGTNSGVLIAATATTPIDYASRIYSIAFWINLPAIGSSEQVIAKYGASDSNRAASIIIHTDGTIRLLERTTGSSASRYSHTALTANTWHHVVVARSTTGIAFYIDGEQKHSDDAFSFNFTPGNGGTEPIRFGRNNTSTPSYGELDLDQVRFFTSTLTEANAATLYAEQACVHTATTTDSDYPTTNSAYYKLDNSAEDSKGTNDGTETDIEYRFGKYGQAAVFNGSSSGIGLPKNSTISPANDFTYSLWFKSDGTTFQTLFSHLGNTNPKYGAFLNHSSDTSQSIRFFFSTGTNSQGNSSSVSNVWNAGKWHNLVITKSSTAGLKGYLDTIEIISNTALTADLTPYTLQNGNSNLGVYQYQTSGGKLYHMDGLIDQVRIFPTVLSSSQITQLYNEKPETDTSNFKAVLYTGTSSSQYISNVGFNLDVDNGGDGGYVWVKQRTTPTRHHRNYDTVRGVFPLYSSLDNLQGSTNPIDYDANGFSFAGGESGVNENAEDYVAWVWRAGGQATNIGVNSITGSTPSIASDVSANTAAGFSIVKVTYNTSSPHTVAHGLSSAPEVIFGKRVSGSSVSTGDWNTYHKFIDPDTSAPETYFIKLNERDGRADNAIYWNDTAPTSSVFTTGSIYDQNETVIFYCWHSVSGYSKIGTYEGNGTTDNKIFTTDDGQSTGSNGFKPNFVMLKNVDRDNTGWLIHDTARDPVNTSIRTILANADTNEYVTTAYWLMDFESDGFRLKYGADNEFNRSGDTYVFMAFK
jgi:hypothetical protein